MNCPHIHPCVLSSDTSGMFALTADAWCPGRSGDALELKGARSASCQVHEDTAVQDFHPYVLSGEPDRRSVSLMENIEASE